MLKDILIHGHLSSLWISVSKDRSGGTILIFALLLPVIIGAVGLGIETSMWFSAVRQMQSAADAATIAAAYETIAAAYEVRNGEGAATIASPATNQRSCNKKIGYTITFNGNAKMNNSCSGSVMSSIDIKHNVKLVE